MRSQMQSQQRLSPLLKRRPKRLQPRRRQQARNLRHPREPQQLKPPLLASPPAQQLWRLQPAQPRHQQRQQRPRNRLLLRRQPTKPQLQVTHPQLLPVAPTHQQPQQQLTPAMALKRHPSRLVRAQVIIRFRRSKAPVLPVRAPETIRSAAPPVCDRAELLAHRDRTRRACRNGQGQQVQELQVGVRDQVADLEGEAAIATIAVAAPTQQAPVLVALAPQEVKAGQVKVAAQAVAVPVGVAVSKVAAAVPVVDPDVAAPVAEVAQVAADVPRVVESRNGRSAKSSTIWQHRLSVRPPCQRATVRRFGWLAALH